MTTVQNPLPPLSPPEFESLKESIRQNGVLDPIVVSAGPACFGQIGDGHHRQAIAAELGIDCPRTTRTFDSEAEFRIFQIVVNLERRQLTDVQRAEMGMALEPWEAKLAEERKRSTQAGVAPRGPDGKVAPTGAGQSATTGRTRDQVAAQVGLSGRTYTRIRAVLNSEEDDLKQGLRDGEIRPAAAEEELQRRRGVATAPRARRPHEAGPAGAVANVAKRQLKAVDHIIERLAQLEGAITINELGLDLTETITPEIAAERAEQLAKVISPLRRLHNKLKERASQ